MSPFSQRCFIRQEAEQNPSFRVLRGRNSFPQRGHMALGIVRGAAIKILLLIIALSTVGVCQYVNTTAFVTDPYGRPYSNGTFQAVWVNQSGSSQLPLLNGYTFQTTVVGALNSAGYFTTQVADNNQITPTPSQWQWTICTQKITGQSSICFTTLITMTGATQNISAALNAAALPIPTSGPNTMTNGSLYGTTANFGTIAGGAMNPKSLSNVQIVTAFSGSDPGAQLNAAVAAANGTPTNFYFPSGTYPTWVTPSGPFDPRIVTITGAGASSTIFACDVPTTTLAIAASPAGAVENNAATIATITTTAAVGPIAGLSVTITGVTNTAFNGTFQVLEVPSSTSFTVANTAPSADATSGGGSAVYQPPCLTLDEGESGFSIAVAGEVGGFTMTGLSSVNNQVGVKVGNVVGESIKDISAQEFTGSNSIGLYLYNHGGGFMERLQTNRITPSADTIGTEFNYDTTNAGSESFGYANELDFDCLEFDDVSSPNGACVYVANGLIYHTASFHLLAEAHVGTTALKIAASSNAQLYDNNYSIFGEGDGVGINLGSDAIMTGYGVVDLSGINANSVQSGTYTSGITATGTAGETCLLSSFNNSASGTTATLELTGTNTIATGTALLMTAGGSGATAAPTSASVASGTATCSGTATVSTVLGGPAIWAGSPTDSPQFRIVPGRYEDLPSDVGSVSNYNGSGNAATAFIPYPLDINAPYAGLGFFVGSQIAAPFVTMANIGSPVNAFQGLTCAVTATNISQCLLAWELDKNGNGTFTGSVNGEGGYTASSSGNLPGSGYVGNVVTATTSSGSPVSLTSGTGAEVASISLPAGNWDISAIAFLGPGSGTSVSACTFGIGFSATAPTQDSGRRLDGCPNTQVFSNSTGYALPLVRMSLSSTTTVYLNAVATFTVSTLSAYGTITAKQTP